MNDRLANGLFWLVMYLCAIWVALIIARIRSKR